jgi:hypothetical protein
MPRSLAYRIAPRLVVKTSRGFFLLVTTTCHENPKTDGFSLNKENDLKSGPAEMPGFQAFPRWRGFQKQIATSITLIKLDHTQ